MWHYCGWYWRGIQFWRISFCWIGSVIATMSWRHYSLTGPISRSWCQVDIANSHRYVFHLQYISNVIATLRVTSLQYRYNIRISTGLIFYRYVEASCYTIYNKALCPKSCFQKYLSISISKFIVLFKLTYLLLQICK